MSNRRPSALSGHGWGDVSRAGSHKNSTYTAFREVGRVIRTVQLLRCLSDAPLRRRVTAATNKVESFNRFSQWVGFGNQGVFADSTHELADEPDAYDPRLDVDFTPIRGDGPPADGFGQAA
ncbi:transposase (plasmid) [Streptomyces sp. NBC_00842]|nr:transposase [Streptomyces sp. NBC_00842]